MAGAVATLDVAMPEFLVGGEHVALGPSSRGIVPRLYVAERAGPGDFRKKIKKN